MCLQTKQKWPKIAWKPITTYKVVYSPDNHQSFLTLYQAFPIKIGQTYKETLRNIFKNREKLYKFYEMSFGLHSYTSETYSKATARRYDERGARVVKCIIPGFSLYWIGANYDILSNRLKYVKLYNRESYQTIVMKW